MGLNWTGKFGQGHHTHARRHNVYVFVCVYVCLCVSCFISSMRRVETLVPVPEVATALKNTGGGLSAPCRA